VPFQRIEFEIHHSSKTIWASGLKQLDAQVPHKFTKLADYLPFIKKQPVACRDLVMPGATA